MTTQIITTYDDPYYSETVTLDGVPYLFSFALNFREGEWYVSLATAEGDPIASGLKVLCQWDILGPVVDPRRPPGKLACFSNSTDLSPPGPEDLVAGGRCVLEYVPIADLQAARALLVAS